MTKKRGRPKSINADKTIAFRMPKSLHDKALATFPDRSFSKLLRDGVRIQIEYREKKSTG